MHKVVVLQMFGAEQRRDSPRVYLGHQTVVDFARPVFTISFSESVIDNSYEAELKLCGLGHAAGLKWYLKVMKESHTYSFVPWFFLKS